MLRRQFITSVSAAIATTGFFAGPAFALTTSRAKSLVNKMVGEINRTIASGKSQNAMISDFQRVFQRYGDVPTIATYALGVDGRRASTGQKRAFQSEFSKYVARKYGKRFRDFAGGEIKVKNVRKVKSWYEVRCMAHVPGYSPFAVDFFVSDRSGRDLFFDMRIEGVRLLPAEKTEIGAMIDKRGGNIDAMIRDLRNAG